MSVLELAIAGLLLLGGIRSLWTWSRRSFEGSDVTDHLLWAAYLTGRIGLWFAFAGLFALYAATSVDGQPSSAFDRFRWFLILPVLLAALQLLAGYALGRRASD